MAYFVGTREFVHKGAARAEVRRVLHSYPAGHTLKKNDFELIANLLAMHPEAEKKIGCGIRLIRVGPIRHRGRLRPAEFCFWVHRLDGSSEPFSYKKCFTTEKTMVGARVAC